MQKRRMLVLLALAATLAVGCEPGAEMVEFGSVNGLVADDAETDAGVAEDVDTAVDSEGDASVADTDDTNADLVFEEQPDRESPEKDVPPALDVMWTDEAESSAKGTLSFTVTNTRQEDFEFGVAVVSESLIGSAVREVGKGALEPGESQSFTIRANELPLRSLFVRSQVSVRITRSIETPEGSRPMVEDLAPRFIEHNAGYGRARAFSEHALRGERNGVLFSKPFKGAAAKNPGAEIVGDAWNGKAFSKKAAGDDGIFLRDEDGMVYGIVTEIRLGQTTPEELAAAEAAADEATSDSAAAELGEASETEVGHE